MPSRATHHHHTAHHTHNTTQHNTQHNTQHHTETETERDRERETRQEKKREDKRRKEKTRQDKRRDRMKKKREDERGNEEIEVIFFPKNVSEPSNPPDELAQNVSKKKIPFRRIIPPFFLQKCRIWPFFQSFT